jgi:hypothetical protein
MAVFNSIIAADIRVSNNGTEPTVEAVRTEYEINKATIANKDVAQDLNGLHTNKNLLSMLSKFIMLKRSLSNKKTYRIIDQVTNILAQFFVKNDYNFSPDTFDDIQFG